MQQQPLRCPFYDKVGACRHGSQCSRRHVKPLKSKTVVFWKLYENPQTEVEDEEFKQFHLKQQQQQQQKQPQKQQQQQQQPLQYRIISTEALKTFIDTFFLDLISEVSSYGQIMEIAICCNRNAHLSGNVFVRFSNPTEAQACVDSANDKWFNESPVYCELSPVNDLQDAMCGEYLKTNACSRGPHCNFIHPKLPSRETALKAFEASLNS